MMNCNGHRAQAVFLAAIEIADADARSRFVDRQCADDENVRVRVHALLGAHDAPGGLLEDSDRSPGGADSPADFAEEQSGDLLAGRYRLLHPIGEGGMGSVWVAEQSEPVRRRVAVKLVKLGVDSRQSLARFEAERQALALMDHPSIAKVFDGGITAHGRSFLVMEYVDGTPLTYYCDQARLSIRQRLQLFVPVCRAVQHAHQKGIIHRDLKPSNILVCDRDGKPTPIVIDFGLAKTTQEPLTEYSLQTAQGLMLGTPLYMSPEQAELGNADIDTRTDIFSLGVILYELLSGTTPMERGRFQGVGLVEMLRSIKEDDPPRPSSRVSGSDQRDTIAAQRSAKAEQLLSTLASDLDWITLKALEKERNRRYPTANSLARDVERYLNDETVDATPPSAMYRWRKFLCRNRAVCWTAGTFAVLLLASTAVSIWFAVRAVRAERDIRRALNAEAAQHHAAIVLAQSESDQRAIAEAAEQQVLDAYRASFDDVIEQLIGSRPGLGVTERNYLEKARRRWQEFAHRQGTDERSRMIRGEGHYRVALLWQQLGQLPEARTEYEEARVIHAGLVEEFPDQTDHQFSLAQTENNLASVLTTLGSNDDAQVHYQSSRELWTTLIGRHPDNDEYRQMLAGVHHNMGLLHTDLGDYELARREFRRALDIREALVQKPGRDPGPRQELARTLNCEGALCVRLGELDEALAIYRAAQEIQQKLVDEHPSWIPFQRDLANTTTNLGVQLNQANRHEESRIVCQKACDILSQLADQFPSVPDYRQELAGARSNLGSSLLELGRIDESLVERRAARDLFRQLVDEAPQIPDYQRELANVHNSLGALLQDLDRTEEARKEYEGAIVLLEQLVERYPSVPRNQVYLAGACCNVGQLLLIQGEPLRSLPWFDRAVQQLQVVHGREPHDYTAQRYLRNSHYGRAMAHDQLQSYSEAVADWDRTVDLSSEDERVHYIPRRAVARMKNGQMAEAIAEIEQLMSHVSTKQADMEPTEAKPGDGESRVAACGGVAICGHAWYECARVFSLASQHGDNEARQRYTVQAIETLKYAAQSGCVDIQRIRNDEDLNPLRVRPEFEEIVARLSATSGGQ